MGSTVTGLGVPGRSEQQLVAKNVAKDHYSRHKILLLPAKRSSESLVHSRRWPWEVCRGWPGPPTVLRTLAATLEAIRELEAAMDIPF